MTSIPTSILFEQAEHFFAEAQRYAETVPRAASGYLECCFGIIRCFDLFLREGGLLESAEVARLNKLKESYGELNEALNAPPVPPSIPGWITG